MNAKVALITGSGKARVGNTVARAMAERGYRVAVHYLSSADEAAETVAELGRLTECIAVRADLTIESEVQSMVREVVDRFGRVDVLVNCAAIWQARPLERVTAADVRRHFEVNVLGTFLCSQAVGLYMVEQPGGGVIITVGDWAVARPYRNYAAYFPSKGAIPALTRALAVELAHRNRNIRVNCILPGPVMLPADMAAAEREMVVRGTLVKREGSAENIAQAVLFLVDNDFVTGVSLPVDGGRTVYAGDDDRGS